MERDETRGTKVMGVVDTKKIQRWDHSYFLTLNGHPSHTRARNTASCRSLLVDLETRFNQVQVIQVLLSLDRRLRLIRNHSITFPVSQNKVTKPILKDIISIHK